VKTRRLHQAAAARFAGVAPFPASPLPAAIDAVAATTGFSGVVRVDRGDTTEVDVAFGLADRRHGIAMTPTTRLGIASGTKGPTALTVMSLVVEGAVSLDTPVRDVLGTDLPLVDDRVTVEHFLEHRSGIGDYVDEEAVAEVTDHVLTVPAHTLGTTEDYLPALDGLAHVSTPGKVFAYNNSGYVLLAVVAGRVAGRPFEELVADRVCVPAGMPSTAFLRSDELRTTQPPATCGPTGPARTSCTCPSWEVGTVACTRPLPTWPSSGAPCSRVGSCRATWSPRWSGPRAPRSPTPRTAGGSGWARRTEWSPSSGATQGSRSAACTTACSA